MDCFELSPILTKYRRILSYSFGFFPKFFGFCCILSNYFRILLDSLEFFRILVNILGFSGIRSDLSNQLEFRICPDFSEFSRIFLDSLQLFRIPLKTFVSSRIFYSLTDFFVLSQIFPDSSGFSQIFSKLGWILLNSPQSSRNIVGFCCILSDSLKFFSDSVGFSRIILGFS